MHSGNSARPWDCVQLTAILLFRTRLASDHTRPAQRASVPMSRSLSSLMALRDGTPASARSMVPPGETMIVMGTTPVGIKRISVPALPCHSRIDGCEKKRSVSLSLLSGRSDTASMVAPTGSSEARASHCGRASLHAGHSGVNISKAWRREDVKWTCCATVSWARRSWGVPSLRPISRRVFAVSSAVPAAATRYRDARTPTATTPINPAQIVRNRAPIISRPPPPEPYYQQESTPGRSPRMFLSIAKRGGQEPQANHW